MQIVVSANADEDDFLLAAIFADQRHAMITDAVQLKLMHVQSDQKTAENEGRLVRVKFRRGVRIGTFELTGVVRFQQSSKIKSVHIRHCGRRGVGTNVIEIGMERKLFEWLMRRPTS